MCGRYTVGRPGKVISKTMDRAIAGEISLPTYNASPGQRLPVILDSDPRAIVPVLWGVRPKTGSLAGRMLINARAETVHERPLFRDSFSRRRCLVVADGFYEWQKIDGGKQPLRITLADDALFTFAGIWLEGKGEPVYVILTTTPNRVTASIHNRMPVILENSEQDLWLDRELELGGAQNLLDPYPDQKMVAYPVSRAVNNWRNDGPELIQEVNPGQD